MQDKTIVMRYYSLSNWVDTQKWDTYFRELETLIDDTLYKLDTDDPLRRIADTKLSEGAYVCAFEPKEKTRWLFGTFKHTKVNFSIHYYRYLTDAINDISLYIPLNGKLKNNFELIEKIFHLGNTILTPYYAYSEDYDFAIHGYRYCSSPWNVQREIMLYWLTYLSRPYCEFFGEKLTQLNECNVEFNDSGVLLKLSNSPDDITYAQRKKTIDCLGEKSFAMLLPPNQDEAVATLSPRPVDIATRACACGQAVVNALKSVFVKNKTEEISPAVDSDDWWDQQRGIIKSGEKKECGEHALTYDQLRKHEIVVDSRIIGWF